MSEGQKNTAPTNKQGRMSSTRTRQNIMATSSFHKIITRHRKRQLLIAIGAIKEVKLTMGYVALVSAKDYARVIKHKWTAHVTLYTVYASYSVGSGTNRKRIMMHNFIMSPDKGLEVDHKNRNGLHNYRSNLRVGTHSANCSNQKSRNSFGYKGVYKQKGQRRYFSQVLYNGNMIKLGRFDTPEQAALAYDEMAYQLWGTFAHLNFPDRHTLPDLTGFFEPDVRPFKWPNRRRAATQEELEQPMLFNEQIRMPRGPCDECGSIIIEYAYTSLHLWNQVAQYRERICSTCFAKLHKRRDNEKDQMEELTWI